MSRDDAAGFWAAVIVVAAVLVAIIVGGAGVENGRDACEARGGAYVRSAPGTGHVYECVAPR